jgi:hypothetical protein
MNESSSGEVDGTRNRDPNETIIDAAVDLGTQKQAERSNQPVPVVIDKRLDESRQKESTVLSRALEKLRRRLQGN